MIFNDRTACSRASMLASLGALVLLTFGATSCTSTAVLPPPSPEMLRSLELFDGASGEAATWQELEDRVDQADIIVIGELHGHPVGLPFAALLFEGSLERNPSTALSLEFITRDRQYLLDAYSAGLIDWEALEDGMQGSRGSTVEPHKAMIEAARKAGRPIFAANAPRIYTTAARKRGYEALSDLSAEQQRLFDVPEVMPSGGYRDRFFELFRSMSADDDEAEEAADVEGPAEELAEEEMPPEPPTEAMESVFRSQSLWDGTMSATTSRAFSAGNRPVFLVIGQFHCDSDGGTVQLLRRMQPEAKILVVSVADTWSESLLEDDEGRADFIVYVGPFPEEE